MWETLDARMLQLGTSKACTEAATCHESSSTRLPEEVLRLAMHNLRGLSWCGQAANLGQQAWAWAHAAQFLWALLQCPPCSWPTGCFRYVTL